VKDAESRDNHLVPHRVLLVEDFPALRRSYGLMLRENGYTAFEAWDFEAAFEMTRLAVPDVLVLDERVVDAEPFAFRRLKTDPRLRDVLVIALSAGIERRKALIERGVHAVVGKLVTEQHLVAAVRWVLEVYRGDVLNEAG
jgi:DNA-binding response OmpR family regulator